MTTFEITVLGLFRFIVLSAGLTYVLTQSVIFAPVRGVAFKLFGSLALYFVYCPACVGTWMGLALYGLGLWPAFGHEAWVEALVAVFASTTWNRLMPQDDMNYEISMWGAHDKTKEGQDV